MLQVLTLLECLGDKLHGCLETLGESLCLDSSFPRLIFSMLQCQDLCFEASAMIMGMFCRSSIVGLLLCTIVAFCTWWKEFKSVQIPVQFAFECCLKYI